MPTLVPHYHVGIIVPDLDRAKAQMSAQLGVTWGPVLRLERAEFRDGDGNDLLLPTSFCYSVEQPCLELIEEVPGTVWVRNEHSNLHHLGFWSDDLSQESTRLTAAGCPLQFCGRAAEVAPLSFAYHRNDLGVRIEIVDATMREAMSFLFQPDEG